MGPVFLSVILQLFKILPNSFYNYNDSSKKDVNLVFKIKKNLSEMKSGRFYKEIVSVSDEKTK